MENKHFSHPHGLMFNPMPPNSETNCSGCNFPCSGNTYYCWDCKYFLHEQCFCATRSIDHPSHPPHPLTLMPSATHSSGSFICDSCKRPGSGFSYTCSKCDFDLHVHCSNNHPKSTPDSSQPKPTQIHHKSHPQHPLELLPCSAYPSGCFNCNACLQDGKSSVYHCSTCQFDLHKKCASLPETMKRDDHEHQLTLHFSVQGTDMDGNASCTCDVCFRAVAGGSWTYYCAECDFETHVYCVKAKARSRKEVAAEQNLAAQVELINIQNKLHLNRMKNDAIASLFYDPRRYY